MKTESKTSNKASGSSNTEKPPKKVKSPLAVKNKSVLKKQLNCGSCSGLTRNPVLETRCADLGKLPTSRACGSHNPDVFTLAGGEERVSLLLPLAEIMARMKPNDLQIMASLMLEEKTTRKNGFKFKQKVYIRVQGDAASNYMSNFAVGYVLDATKEHVRVMGESGSLAITFLNDRDSNTLYTVERFNEIRRAMVAAKAFDDPKLATFGIPTKAPASAVKSFDDAVEEGMMKKTKRSERGDLVSLVSRLTKGHLRVDKPEKVKMRQKDSSGTTVKFVGGMQR